jgi:recombination protein RecT
MSESELTVTNRPVFEKSALSSRDMFIKVVGENGESTFLKEAAFAIQALRGSEELQKCNHQSITDAVVNVALTGTSLNPALHFAYLVPRKGKCCLDISYRGLAKIATDSKAVLAIEAQVVLEKDFFEYEYGLDQKLKHIPSTEENRGKITHAYMIAHLASGLKILHVMGKADLDKTKATAKTKFVWNAWEDEMCRKTVVKRGYKLLPQTDQMSLAVAVINEHEGLVKESNTPEPVEVIDECQLADMEVVLEQLAPHIKKGFLTTYGIHSLEMMPVSEFKDAMESLEEKRKS